MGGRDWTEAAEEAMLAEPYFWLWGSKPGMFPMPVIVYGFDRPYFNRPLPKIYSYVVFPKGI